MLVLPPYPSRLNVLTTILSSRRSHRFAVCHALLRHRSSADSSVVFLEPKVMVQLTVSPQSQLLTRALGSKAPTKPRSSPLFCLRVLLVLALRCTSSPLRLLEYRKSPNVFLRHGRTEFSSFGVDISANARLQIDPCKWLKRHF